MTCSLIHAPRNETPNAIFFVKVTKKNLPKRKNLYLAFVNLEKAFNSVPRDSVWWVFRKLGTEEWLVKIPHSVFWNPEFILTEAATEGVL